MPRDYDSDEQARTGHSLVLTANVDCEGCNALYEGTWTDDSIAYEDMAEAPVADMTCPSCGHVQTEEYPGWMNLSEAG